MRIAAKGILLLVCLGTVAIQAQIAKFQHIVLIVQENRTPDNLFQGLCAPPFGSSASCSTAPTSSQYNIQTSNWLDRSSPTHTTQPTAVPLGIAYDISHVNKAFVQMCHADASGVCRMDGASAEQCIHPLNCPPKPQFKFVDNSTGVLNPYLELATQYGWANYMFQTNQGPSFPAHQFLFGGTSAPSAADDAAGIFVADGENRAVWGCISPSSFAVPLIGPGLVNQTVYPCFEHQTMPDLLPPSVTWRYYGAGPHTGWTAPVAIQHICQSTGFSGQCAGPQWLANVDLQPKDVLKDIAACNLRSVSWVIPTVLNSDHAGNPNTVNGPSWVASIVNAIAAGSACDSNTGYWNDTAIFIVWDDWGGWYDHEPPKILPPPEGDYQYGFRVPLVVVSAYTAPGYIDNKRYDFGSILRFIEQNFGIAEGALNFSDARAANDLTSFFNLNQAPRGYTPIPARLGIEYFLNDKTPPTDPDDDQ